MSLLAELDWYVWLLVLGPPVLVVSLIYLYVMKRRLGSQGWRRTVPGNVPSAFGLVVQGICRGVGRVVRKVPWKPLLIWGPWVVIVGMLLFHGVENWRGGRAWAKVRGEWVGRGEKLEVQAFLPALMADEENFARHPAVVAEVASGDPLSGMRELGIAEFSRVHSNYSLGTPQRGERAKVDLWLEASAQTGDEARSARRTLELLGVVEGRMAGVAEGARRPGCRFDQHRDPKNPVMSWDDPLRIKVLGFARMFSQRALLRIRVGDGAGALADVETVFLLAEKVGADPTMLGALIGGALCGWGSVLVWDGLQEGVWNAEQLAGLEDWLPGIDLRRSGMRAMRCEAAYQVEIYLGLAERRITWPALVGGSSHAPLGWMLWSGSPGWWDDGVEAASELLFRLVPSGWYRGWLADGLLRMDRAVFRPGGVRAERLEAGMIGALEKEGEGLAEAFMGQFRSQVWGSAGGLVSRMLHLQGEVDLMRVGVALERYRLRVGRYPERLEELVPGELAVLPVDLVSGEALRYRVKADGTPLVWEVGFDGKDDGGVPARQPEALDWVWQYTATEGQTGYEYSQGER